MTKLYAVLVMAPALSDACQCSPGERCADLKSFALALFGPVVANSFLSASDAISPVHETLLTRLTFYLKVKLD
jgi:hypothetical protein